MSRLDKDRQKRLEPIRVEHAKREIEKRGYEVVQIGETELRFEHKGKKVSFFPYSGWVSGSSVENGRGLGRLLKQLDDANRL